MAIITGITNPLLARTARICQFVPMASSLDAFFRLSLRREFCYNCAVEGLASGRGRVVRAPKASYFNNRDGEEAVKRTLFKTVFACLLAAGLTGYGYMPAPHQKLPSPRDLKPRKGLRIRPAEATHVKFVKYVDPSGFFTMNIPLGWRVKTGLKPDGKFDIISYAITVYDPKRPERELYFCLNNAVGLKSAEARNWYIRSYGPKSYFAQMPVLPKLSTAGFFAAMGPSFGYGRFTVLESLGRSALGGDVVVAECTTASGRRVQGLYHAVVSGMMKQPVQVNPFNARAGMVDVGPVMEFSILSETAPKEEFVDWLAGRLGARDGHVQVHHADGGLDPRHDHGLLPPPQRDLRRALAEAQRRHARLRARAGHRDRRVLPRRERLHRLVRRHALPPRHRQRGLSDPRQRLHQLEMSLGSG